MGTRVATHDILGWISASSTDGELLVGIELAWAWALWTTLASARESLVSLDFCDGHENDGPTMFVGWYLAG